MNRDAMFGGDAAPGPLSFSTKKSELFDKAAPSEKRDLCINKKQIPWQKFGLLQAAPGDLAAI